MAQSPAAEAQFLYIHYCRNPSTDLLDTLFISFYMLMIACSGKLNPQKLSFFMRAALIICAAALYLKVFHRRRYTKMRPVLVFWMHFLFLTLRAACTWLMQSEQAVHWRTNSWRAGNKYTLTDGAVTYEAPPDTLLSFLLSMCNTTGGLLRVFEVLGLQQPFHLQVRLAFYALLVQSFAGFAGFRLAYNNGMFFNTHEAYDAVSSVLDTLIDSILPLPTSESESCSSCPGVAVYLTVLLLTLIAAPLYISYALEQSARRRFYRRLSHATAAAAASAASTSAASSSQSNGHLQQVQQAGPAAAAAGYSSSREHPHSPGGSNSLHSTAQQQEQQQQAAAAAAAVVVADESWKLALQQADTDASLGSYLTSCCLHLLVMLLLLLLSWVVSNVVAQLLLPVLLSSQQLQRWCPNRPMVPFKIAGEVYYFD